MLRDHIRRNVERDYPGLELDGDETPEELKRKIRAYKEEKLAPEQLKEVQETLKILKKYGLDE